MSILTITTFLSIDGIMQAPGGPDEDRSNGFDRGGWQVPFADDEGFGWVAEWFSQADCFLLGRKTYDIFANYWPRVTDAHHPVAGPLNALPKYVASSKLQDPLWQNTTVLRGKVVDQIRELKRRPGREIQVHGSGDLAQTLIEHDLIDEYRMWVYPVMLGAGKRLFPTHPLTKSLRLVETRITGTGVAVHVYRPAGAFTTGSFALSGAAQVARAVSSASASLA
ncbi:dihydrofolate reductase family protein [Cryobacterium roopkundense]|uniref:Dihydrofolate reductase n=1 Tax=Cryobacterium roopkundense TaxID=1001240 RepID=A0A7W8ZZ19_9MICO|nr:dihydrofolate reductase family protein [Cryobacterium roopkundense]MBB5642555.1 dihydrofolate reductase [Cryobacterium roopkundense]